jgi:hypothetical protein
MILDETSLLALALRPLGRSVVSATLYKILRYD